MPHALTELNLAEVTKPAAEPAHEIRADVCVVGAGIAGLSAAIESARLHRDVVLVDSLPLIGGQMVHSLIGLFCGVFGNGPEYRQLTHVTHIEAPLDPVAASRAQFDGRDQADTVIALLRSEFPKAFGKARVRAYGYPGRRQTRWIKGRHQLTTDQVRHGTRFDDAVARTAWPIELHDRPDGYVWEMFGPDHVHYVPLRVMTPPGAHNLVAAGRCVDGDAAALSSVRVMGPCAAMGAGAAHALDLAGRGSVHDVDLDRLRDRLIANVSG